MKTTITTNLQHGTELAIGELSTAIFEAAVDAMIVINQYGIIHALNPAAERTFGFNRTELIGHNVSILMPKQEAKKHDGYLNAYATTGERKMIGKSREVVGKKKDGSLFPMHLSVGELSVGEQKLYIGICHDTSSNKQMLEKISYIATHDSLTGCLNRNYLHSNIEKLMTECREQHLQLAVLFIDLDGFKHINDHYNHDVGDRILASVAQRIKEQLKDDDLIARIGGDEFLVASNQARKSNAPHTLAHDILNSIKKPFNIDGIEVGVRASIGISLYPGHSKTSDQLINDADIAMYKAKMAGGNCVAFFELEQREKLETVFKTVNRLRKAIELDQFELHYQLQFELSPPYRAIGVEALLRWRDGENGLIMPDDFIELILEHGMMHSITCWVIERACRDNLSLISEQLLDVPISVNACSYSFLHKNYIKQIKGILKRIGLPADRLEIEITESVTIDNFNLARETILKLNAMGICIAIDDFGTGYSSPAILKHLPVQRLKIDRSFVDELPHSTFNQAVIKSMLIVAQSIDMQVISEGVETIEQVNFLLSLGCTQGQGYWYSKPLPLCELKALLKQKAKVM